MASAPADAMRAVAVSVLALVALALANRSGSVPQSSSTPLLFRDGSLSTKVLRSAEVSWHGGTVAANTGEQVTVFISDSYDADPNDVHEWADFLAGLIHGSELGLLTAYIATPGEVASLCDSSEVVGCYEADRLVAVGEIVNGLSPQEVVRHEYGHHVAAHRLNSPWPSLNWGPKRWASQVNVCARAAAGTAFPGDETAQYTLNPGEAFAETYRALNDVRSSGAAIDWPLIDASFLPNAAALAAVQQDVLHPWTAATTTVVHGRLAATGRSTWSMPARTPLDGNFTVDFSFAPTARYDVTLMDAPAKRVLARGALSGPSSEQLTYLVCGLRSVRLVVSRRVGSGAFSLHITRP